MSKLKAPRVPLVPLMIPTPMTPEGWHPKKTTTKEENVEIFHRRTYNEVVAGKSILYVTKGPK